MKQKYELIQPSLVWHLSSFDGVILLAFHSFPKCLLQDRLYLMSFEYVLLQNVSNMRGCGKTQQ